MRDVICAKMTCCRVGSAGANRFAIAEDCSAGNGGGKRGGGEGKEMCMWCVGDSGSVGGWVLIRRRLVRSQVGSSDLDLWFKLEEGAVGGKVNRSISMRSINKIQF